jgi:hypothetical protein
VLDSVPRRGVAQSGSAPVWGTGGRRFKSGRPDQLSCRKPAQVAGFVVSRLGDRDGEAACLVRLVAGSAGNTGSCFAVKPQTRANQVESMTIPRSVGAARRQNSTDEGMDERDMGLYRRLTRSARGAVIAVVLALLWAAPAAAAQPTGVGDPGTRGRQIKAAASANVEAKKAALGRFLHGAGQQQTQGTGRTSPPETAYRHGRSEPSHSADPGTRPACCSTRRDG